MKENNKPQQSNTSDEFESLLQEFIQDSLDREKESIDVEVLEKKASKFIDAKIIINDVDLTKSTHVYAKANPGNANNVICLIMEDIYYVDHYITMHLQDCQTGETVWESEYDNNANDVHHIINGIEKVLKPGKYMLYLYGVEFEDNYSSRFYENIDGSYVLPFLVVDEENDLHDHKLVETTSTPSGQKVRLRFDKPLQDNYVFQYFCYTAESLTYVNDGEKIVCVNSSCTVEIELSQANMVEGEYKVLISANKSHVCTLNLTKTSSQSASIAISNTEANLWRNMLFMNTSNDKKEWFEFMSIPGYGDLKRHALQKISYHIVNEARRHACLERLPFTDRFCAVADDVENNTAAIAKYFDTLSDSQKTSLVKIDCRTEAESDTDFDFKNYDNPSFLLTRIGAMLEPEMQKFVNNLRHKLMTDTVPCFILLASRTEIDAVLTAYPWLRQYMGDEAIEMGRLESHDACQLIMNELERLQIDLSGRDRKIVFDRIREETRNHRWYHTTVVNLIHNTVVPNMVHRVGLDERSTLLTKKLTTAKASDFNFSPTRNCDDTFKTSMAELNALIGLNELKGKLSTIFQRTRFDSLRRQKGLNVDGMASYHTVFTGNPGTGKTTVAKLMAKIYHSLGIISKGEAIIVDRTMLVGRYIGETEKKMKSVLEQARGNVLFIDEAYTLVADRNSGSDFGLRAIESLLTALAAPNPDMVVILAGYGKEMDDMLNYNPGLKSRFAVRLKFPDYTADELMEIAKATLARQDYKLAPGAEEALMQRIIDELSRHDPTFGNARWINQLIEQQILPSMALRVLQVDNPTVADLRTIKKADIPAMKAETSACKVRRRVGFVA